MATGDSCIECVTRQIMTRHQHDTSSCAIFIPETNTLVYPKQTNMHNNGCSFVHVLETLVDVAIG